jgi:hypothetical protein
MSTYSFSSTLANAVLNVLNGTTIATNAYTTSGNVYVQLHTAAPGTAGTTSISVGSTTRVLVAFGTSSSGTITMTTSNPQWTNGGTSETITAISIWSASTAGTFLTSGALTSSQAWASGNILQLSSLSVSIPTSA